MSLKNLIHRMTAPVDVLDDERLRQFCATCPGAMPVADLQPRQLAAVVGEITSVRIVPRPNGSPWLEATLTDGTGHLVAMWTGRRKIAGIKPGQRLMVRGRGSATGPGGRLLIYNPDYELL